MKISLYIHIPFCVRKCLYCDFLSGPYDSRVRFSYVKALCNELSKRAELYKSDNVSSIFIGGGTPSTLSTDELGLIMDTIHRCYLIDADAEISMEVNPGTIDGIDKLKSLRKMGINRLSIGLQSAKNDELKLLGRIHTREEFERTYGMAVEAGFDNLNVDLISGLPRQSAEDFKESLLYVTSLKPMPTHISAYSLIVEKGTPFYDRFKESDLIDEDVDREIYKITNDILKAAGFHRYEISNYAQTSYECRHNKGYWTRNNYVGFGIGAASLYNHSRWKNTDDINAYIEADGITEREEYQMLSKEEEMSEFMFLGLRLTSGVSVSEFEAYFNCSMSDEYKAIIDKYIKMGLVKIDGDRVMLTEEGLNVSNVIMAEFI